MPANQLLDTVAYFAAIFPVITGLLNYNRLHKNFKLLFWLLVLTLSQDLVRWFFFGYAGDKFILNIYTFLETTMLALTYRLIISSERWKSAILPILLIMLVFMIINMVWIEGPFKLNAWSLQAESVFLVILATRLFLQLSINVPSKSFLAHERFWFNLGVFSYFSLNFFTFMFSDNLFGRTEFDLNGFHLWNIHDITNLFFNISFAIAIWLSSRQKYE